jgi:hypothetical protein
MMKCIDRAKSRAVGFGRDSRAQVNGANRAVDVVVGLLVGSLLSAYLLPLVIDELGAVDTSSWTGGAGELWTLLQLMVVLSIFLFFANLALNAGESS